MPTELFIVENSRKEAMFREAFPNADIFNLSTQFQQAYWLVTGKSNTQHTQLTHQERHPDQIHNLRKRAEHSRQIYLAFDPEHEDLAAACALALEPLRKTAQVLRLCPQALNPVSLQNLLLETQKRIKEKLAPFSPLESQRAMARKALHLETARLLKKINPDKQKLVPLTLAQTLLLDLIYNHEQQDKGTGLLESWREISLQIPLFNAHNNANQTNTLTAELIVPDRAVAYAEQNTERKQIWDQLTITGKQGQTKNRVHHEFYRMQQAQANDPWRFPDVEQAYQVAQQIQRNPRLVLSLAYNELALEKIVPPYHTPALYQSRGPLSQYTNYLHSVLHQDLYQNALITYPETQSTRFPDATYYELLRHLTQTPGPAESKIILVHRPFEDPETDKGQTAVLPAQWDIDTPDKLRNYLAPRNEHYLRKPSYFQIVWEVYNSIYRRALTSQIDFSRQTIDHFYFIGPADPAHPSGVNANASHPHWIFLAKKEVPPNSTSLLSLSHTDSGSIFLPGQIFHTHQPGIRRVKQIKPPAEVSNLVQICKQSEICSPQQLTKHLKYLLKEELLKTTEQPVSNGTIEIYNLTDHGKSQLRLYKEHAPSSVNLGYYRKFHTRLKHIISPSEPKILLDIWTNRLEQEISPHNKIRREPDKEQLKEISDT